MKTVKRIPERMCVACRQMKPKNQLVRIVNTENGVYKYMKTSSGTWNNAGTYSGGEDPSSPLYPRG